MDTRENRSPIILEANVDNASTPEQDPQIHESIMKASLGLKIKKIRSPIVKSKVECEDIIAANGKYEVVKSNPPKGILKNKQNISIKMKTTTTIENTNVPIIAPQIVKGSAKSFHPIPKVSSAGPESGIPNGSSISPKLSITKISNHTTASNGDSSKPVRPARTMKRVNIAPAPEVKSVEKGKYYDPVTVKSFMEQQREVRRLKEKQEQENRRLEAERKKKHLVELNTKQKVLITKSRHAPKVTVSKEDQHVSLATKNYRARKEKALAHSKHSSIADSRDRSKHNLRDRGEAYDNLEGMTELRAEAEAELRTTMILQEFESIVHRECLSVLKLKSTCSKTENTRRINKFDKSSETTFSFLQNDNGTGLLDSKIPPKSNSSHRFHQRELASFVNDAKPKNSRTTDELLQLQNAAATRIQAAFRGFQVRKIWREVEMNEHRHCPIPPRRISFYRCRTSQSNIHSRRLPLMSPVLSPTKSPVCLKPLLRKKSSAFGMSLDYSPYIPPPPPSAFYTENLNLTTTNGTNSVPCHPTSVPVPSRSNGEIRKSSRFEEPFPTEALKQLRKSLHSPVAGSSPVPSDHYLRRDLISSPTIHANMAQIPGISDLLHPPIPTFSMVLKEKVRLLQEMQQRAARKTDHIKTNQMLINESYIDNSYDSDSTQHASIILSSRNGLKRTASSTDVTITDDYIGPDDEAMSIAYNLRKTPRLSLESESDAQISSRVDVEIDNENENDSTTRSVSTYTSNNITIDTEDEPSFHYHRRGREDLNLNRPMPSTSLKDFKLKVNEKKQEILEHAVHVSLDELMKQDKLTELRLRASSNQNLEVQVGQLQQEVTTMNANMTATFGKFVPEIIPPLRLENRDFILEFAKCQSESLKATAEIQQWLVELRRSSQEEIRETRHQETVNIATAVYAAVEEAKKLAQIQQPQSQRHVFQVQGVQTTDSLLQNESIVGNYSLDEFMNTSIDDSRLQEHELLKKLEDSQEEEEEAYQHSISHIGEFEIPISIAEEQVNEENSVSDYETKSDSLVLPSKSLHEITSPAQTLLEKDNEESNEKKVKTIADILREAAAAVAEAHILTAPFKFQKSDIDISITSFEEPMTEDINESQKSKHSQLVSISTTKSINESMSFEKSKDDLLISIEECPTSTKDNRNTLDQSIESEDVPKSDVISPSKPLSFVYSTQEIENERSTEVELSLHSVVPLTATSVASSKLDTAASEIEDEFQPLQSPTEKSIGADEVEKDTLAESIASDVDELSYQSDFISQEPSSLSGVYEGQSPEHELTPDEASKGEEEPKSEFQVVEDAPVSISPEKNTLEQSIASEPSDEQEQSDFLSISSSTSKKSQHGDVEVLSSSSASVNQSEKEEAAVVITPVEEVLPVLDVPKVEEHSPDPDVKILEESVQPSTPEVVPASPENEESLENATLDMMELTMDQEKIGSISRVINKWSDRPRDIVDHVLVGEMIEESPSWTDYRQEEVCVKNALTETVVRRALHQTLSSISKVINSA